MMNRKLVVIAVFFAAVVSMAGVRKSPFREVSIAFGDSLFVYLQNDRLDVYPYAVVRTCVTGETQVIVTTTDEVMHCYALATVDSVTSTAPANKPYLTSFKFNNKYNGQLFTDVEGHFGVDGQITATVSAIGKWLAPSFLLSDKQASAYVGRELQRSKVTRHSYANPVNFVITRDGWQVMTPDGESTTVMAFQPYGTRYTVTVDWLTDHSTSVPKIYITTETGEIPTTRSYYINATISIDGGGVFPDMQETPVQIKGRGNTSWTHPTATNSPKNPYRLKFDSKVKPFGMTKGKSWVLLANSLSGSMMTNAIGMKVAQLAGAAGANHIVPVDLYINGEYRGSYNFTEKVGFHNNSIDLDDESLATLLELDTYTNETIYRADHYNVPVKIHEPDFEDASTVTSLTVNDIMADFNTMLTAAVNRDDISRWVQVDTFAAFFLTNEYILNLELMHPKSTYLYKERVGDTNSLWKFGPVWDLDWAFGHELDYGYFTSGTTRDYVNAKTMECNELWRALRSAGKVQDRAYYKAWTRFIRQRSVDELVDFCQEYFDYAQPSFRKNAGKWGDGNNYDSQVPKQQTWLRNRAENVYQRLTPYDLREDLPEDPLWTPYDDTFYTGIGIVVAKHADNAPTSITAIYNLAGQRLTGLQRGINVVRYSNGTVKQVKIEK